MFSWTKRKRRKKKTKANRNTSHPLFEVCFHFYFDSFFLFYLGKPPHLTISLRSKLVAENEWSFSSTQTVQTNNHTLNYIAITSTSFFHLFGHAILSRKTLLPFIVFKIASLWVLFSTLYFRLIERV